MQRQATDLDVGLGHDEIVQQLRPACKLDGLDDAPKRPLAINTSSPASSVPAGTHAASAV